MNESVLEELIADFLVAIEEGREFDRTELLEQHPELADELNLFFENHDRLHSVMFGESPTEVRGPGGTPKTSDAHFAPTVAFGSVGPAPSRGSTDDELANSRCEFGDYELVSEIARGGMGVVYRARQKRLNRIVALKMILSGSLADHDSVQRFYTEAEAAAGIEHSGIVPIHEVGEYGGVPYYTMSLIEGSSLAQMLTDGPLEPELAALLVKKVAMAVAYAHSRQILHRDLKPANILIDPQGEPRVTDFGLAKRLDSGKELTATGQIIGTLQYMAPEQALGHSENIGPSVDIYALGAVLYAALTGRPPFQAEHHMDVWLQVVDAEPLPPRNLNPAVPRELQRICLRCLEKDPKRRYASADDLVKDLDAFLRGEPLPIATSRRLDTLRRLPRRYPALCAHLVGISVAELFRHARFLAQGFDVVGDDWRYHLQFTWIFVLWALASLILQALSDRWKWSRTGVGIVWSTIDVLFLSWVLLLARGPIGPLFTGFALLVVASISFFRMRVTSYMTVLSMLAFAALIWIRPEEGRPLHYSCVYLATLAVMGVILGYHIRRMQLLSDYYERRV